MSAATLGGMTIPWPLGERDTLDFINEIHEHVTTGADDRERAAEQRHKDLLAAHEQASKLLAETVKQAIENGMREIAQAIRDQRR
jgi:undecaprenyl pyrophosphate synthase